MKNKKMYVEKVRLFKKGIYILWRTSKKNFFSIILISGLSGITGPLNVIIYQKIIDAIVQMISINQWTELGIVWLILFTLIILLGHFLNGVLQYIKQVFSDELDLFITDEVLKKSMKFSMETFDNVEIYNHINIAITQTSHNCLGILDSVSECIYALVKGITFIFILMRFNWIIVIVSILASLPSLFISVKTNSYWYKIFYNRTEKLRLIQYLKMILIKNENIKEIKLYQSGSRIISFIKNHFLEFINHDKIARRSILIKRLFSQGFDEVITLIIKVAILILAIVKKETLGVIVLYFNSQENLKISINELFNQLSILHDSLLYLKSIDIIEKENIESLHNVKPFTNKYSCLEFKNVYFKYPGSSVYVLKNINIKFEKGKTYSIVGFNGSGKTTLIKLLLRLYKPVSGKIYLDNEDIENYDIDTYYANISAVFQDFIKYPFNVIDNIILKKDGKERLKGDIERAIKLADIESLISNLPDKEKTLLMRDWTNGVDISQGQWQKIAIARCLYKNASIVIFDEPFSSIDANAESKILHNLRKEDFEKIMIFVTHRFSSISLADEILVMQNGIVVENGNHNELLKKKGLYFQLYNNQLRQLRKKEEQSEINC